MVRPGLDCCLIKESVSEIADPTVHYSASPFPRVFEGWRSCRAISPACLPRIVLRVCTAIKWRDRLSRCFARNLQVNSRASFLAFPVFRLPGLLPRSGRRLPRGWPSYLRQLEQTSATDGSRPPAFQPELHARPRRASPRVVRRAVHEKACLCKLKALRSRLTASSGGPSPRDEQSARAPFPRVALSATLGQLPRWRYGAVSNTALPVGRKLTELAERGSALKSLADRWGLEHAIRLGA